MPHSNKRLDYGWFQNVISNSSAAKSDNADIDNAIWNQCITLIFSALQHSHSHAFRGGLMQYSSHKLYTEFATYLRYPYPIQFEGYTTRMTSIDVEIYMEDMVLGVPRVSRNLCLGSGRAGGQPVSHPGIWQLI